MSSVECARRAPYALITASGLPTACLGVIVSSSVGGTAEQTVAFCPAGKDVTVDAKF